MQMDVNIVETTHRRVHVRAWDIANTILPCLRANIRPQCTDGFDDWYIKDGLIYGVTEYHHGSDGNTYLGEASAKLEQEYSAIYTVCNMLKELKD